MPRWSSATCIIPVGSYDEPTGKTGLAHFVEHMLFKGTERFPKGQIDRLAFVAAGQSNAETGEDSTHYWFAFPSDRWELALAIESDRMGGATFDPAEVEAERQVIAEERARDQESPFSRLDHQHLVTSYVRHPYRNPILGWPDDLERIERGRPQVLLSRPLPARRRGPGDRRRRRPGPRPGRLRGAIRRACSDEPARPPPAFEEPRQVGRRDFRLVEPESVARGLFGWHTVPLGHPDGPALDILSDLLTCGRRSRLWDHLVEREKLATWVETGQEGARRAGQFLLQVEAVPGADPDRIDRAIADEISPTRRRGADRGRAGPVEEPARSRLAMGAGRPGRPGRGARPVRAQRRLAGLAGRAPGRARGPGRGHPPRGRHLPGRGQPDGRLVDPPTRPVGHGPPAGRGPVPGPTGPAAPPTDQPPIALEIPAGPRSWPIIRPISRSCPTGCES